VLWVDDHEMVASSSGVLAFQRLPKSKAAFRSKEKAARGARRSSGRSGVVITDLRSADEAEEAIFDRPLRDQGQRGAASIHDLRGGRGIGLL